MLKTARLIYTQTLRILNLDNLFDMTLDELLQLNIENTDKAFACYGFINANVEQVFRCSKDY